MTLDIIVTKRRMFLASLGSAVLFMAIASIAAYLEMQTPSQNPDGTPDNAPIRAIGILIILSPLLLGVITGIFFAGGLTLKALGHLKPLVLAGLVPLASIVLGFLMILDRPFGWRDQLHYFVGFTGIWLLVLVPSTLLWWWVVAKKPNRTQEQMSEG
jgi:hypothetical protein